MGRTKVENNIAFDEKRKLYYVTLNWGKGPDGKYRKTCATTKNKREAQRLLKEHLRNRAAETAIAPVNTTLTGAVETYIRYKEASLAATTVYGYNNILDKQFTKMMSKKHKQNSRTPVGMGVRPYGVIGRI